VDVLVVAPDIGLPWAADEARYLVNTLGAKIVSGKVTVASIMDEVDAGLFDVLWFATHGSEAGITLSDDVLTSDILAQIARRCEAKLVFLNACSSDRVAADIYAAVQVPVICTIAETMDYAAYFTGRAFASDLAGGVDFSEAFARSRTQKFRMIPDMGNGRETLNTAAVEQIYRNRNQIWELFQEQKRQSAILDRINKQELQRSADRAEDRRKMSQIIVAMVVLIALVIIILFLVVYLSISFQSLQQGIL
jgi:hypothetical protein